MSVSHAERHQIENEMIFRRANEEVADGLDELDAQLVEDGHPKLTQTVDLILHLSCECSDENCDAKIPIKLSEYRKIHEDRDAFIIKPKHQVGAIEKVVATTDDYSVVEKNNSTAEPNDTLNETSIDNS